MRFLRVWATLVKDAEVTDRAFFESGLSDPSEALMECMENIYKQLDVAEPVWVKKHAAELSRYKSTKFLPQDFLEKVGFDSMHVEYLPD